MRTPGARTFAGSAVALMAIGAVAMIALPTLDFSGPDVAAPDIQDLPSLQLTADYDLNVQSITVAASATTIADDIQMALAARQDPSRLGLYSGPSPKDPFFAPVLVIDGQLITTASAVAGHRSLWLQTGDARVAVRPGPTDPVTDIMILETDLATLPTALIPEYPISDKQLERGIRATIGPLDNVTAGQARSGKIFTESKLTATASGRLVFDTASIDIAAQPGDSGSPIFDADGRLLGIAIGPNTGHLSVLSVQRVRTAVKALATYGSGDTAWLGLSVTPASEGGLLLEDIAINSPAQTLRPGDRLLIAEGWPLEHPDQLDHLARLRGPGSQMAVTIQRGSDTLDLSVYVGSVLDSE